jgi:hypothetical protein
VPTTGEMVTGTAIYKGMNVDHKKFNFMMQKTHVRGPPDSHSYLPPLPAASKRKNYFCKNYWGSFETTMGAYTLTSWSLFWTRSHSLFCSPSLFISIQCGCKTDGTDSFALSDLACVYSLFLHVLYISIYLHISISVSLRVCLCTI